jgi:hypothetical protein
LLQITVLTLSTDYANTRCNAAAAAATAGSGCLKPKHQRLTVLQIALSIMRFIAQVKRP